MNKEQESHFNMMRTVKKYLTKPENLIITATVPVIEGLVETFDNRIGQIMVAITKQGIQISGVAIDKNDLKRTLCRLTAQSAGAAMAYTVSIDNDTMREALNFSVSDLMKERDEDCGPRCLGILEILQSVAAAILPYGVTAAKLEDIADALEVYIEAVPSVRSAEVSKGVQTGKIAKLLEDNNKLLNDQLDGIIQLMEDDYPDFVAGYFLSRKLIDPAHFATAFRIVVLDNATNLEIPNPTMNVTDLDEVVNGNISGVILWKPAQFGDHTFTISADTYAPYDGTVHLTLGAEANLEVKLNRLP